MNSVVTQSFAEFSNYHSHSSLVKVIKKFASVGLIAALLVTSFTSSLAATGSREQLYGELDAKDSKFVSVQNWEIYPHAPDENGFTSVLVVTNLLDTVGFFSIFSVPVGTTEFIGRENIVFQPRETKFFFPRDLALSGTSGQLWVTAANQSSFGASTLYLFGPQGDFANVVPSIVPRP